MLDIKKNLLYRLLAERGREGVTIEEASKTASLSEDIVKEFLEGKRGVAIEGGVIRLVDTARFLLEAWLDGVDVINVALAAGWREFEDFVAVVLSEFGYEVRRNVTFKEGGRRHQIDVLAASKPTLLVIDCKKWSRARTYHLKQAALAQAARTEALLRAQPPELRSLTSGWERGEVAPVIVSLLPGTVRIYEGIPIVPLRLFPPFLKELPAYSTEVLTYDINLKNR